MKTDQQIIEIALMEREQYKGNISPDTGKELTRRFLWETLQKIVNPKLTTMRTL
jgi:hypothetical protein